MKMLMSAVMFWAMAPSHASVAQTSRSIPRAAVGALAILTHLDLNSFPNSTGPRLRRAAHTPIDYGLIKAEGFRDGWAQISEADDSWHMAALVLERKKEAAILCFTDSAGSGGTYRSTAVLKIRLDRGSRWMATRIPDRPDCKNAPPLSQITGDTSRFAPADLLQRLDDFRESLSPSDLRRLDQRLHRSASGGIETCDHAAGSRASCEVAAYMPALRDTGLTARFQASLRSTRSAPDREQPMQREGPAGPVARVSPAS